MTRWEQATDGLTAAVATVAYVGEIALGFVGAAIELALICSLIAAVAPAGAVVLAGAPLWVGFAILLV